MNPSSESVAWLESLAEQSEPPAISFAELVRRRFVTLDQIDLLREAGLEFYEIDGAAYVGADDFVRACRRVEFGGAPPAAVLH